MATVTLGPPGAENVTAEARPAPAVSEPEGMRPLLRRLTLALLAAGVVWRTLRYLLRFPIWGDEASLCLNLLELDYAGLTHELRHCQVAPLLFLWGQATALRLLGGSELALRLLPYLAGLGSLFLFWRLARLTLTPLAATLALGFLAVAVWPVSMGTFAKPYSFDLFMALALLLPAAHWLRRPRDLRWLALLTAVTPVAVFGSYPAVFIGGAVGLALLPTAWRQQGWGARLLYLAYGATLLASFLAHFATVGRGQLGTPLGGMSTETGMQSYWADGFPPASPLPLAKWLLCAHTGQMVAYPVGSQDGGSSLTALLSLAGAWQLWKTRRRAVVVLCAAPFALGLLAAALHRYPYGASGRLSQYLAPAVCLTAGAGAAALIERARSAALRRRWVVGVGTLFVGIGLAGMACDLIRPYRDRETQWTRQVMRGFAAAARSGAPIVVVNNPQDLDSLVRWHLELYGDRVSWGGKVDWAKAAASGEVLCVRYWWHRLEGPEQLARAPSRGPTPVADIAPLKTPMSPGGGRWVLKEAVTDTGVPNGWREPVKHLDQCRWVLEGPAPAR